MKLNTVARLGDLIVEHRAIGDLSWDFTVYTVYDELVPVATYSDIRSAARAMYALSNDANASVQGAWHLVVGESSRRARLHDDDYVIAEIIEQIGDWTLALEHVGNVPWAFVLSQSGRRVAAWYDVRYARQALGDAVHGMLFQNRPTGYAKRAAPPDYLPHTVIVYDRSRPDDSDDRDEGGGGVGALLTR